MRYTPFSSMMTSASVLFRCLPHASCHQLPAQVLAIPPHAILKRERPARAALDDTGLRKVVDFLRRHAEDARQGVRVRRFPS
jgi:hypothetical protein